MLSLTQRQKNSLIVLGSTAVLGSVLWGARELSAEREDRGAPLRESQGESGDEPAYILRTPPPQEQPMVSVENHEIDLTTASFADNDRIALPPRDLPTEIQFIEIPSSALHPDDTNYTRPILDFYYNGAISFEPFLTLRKSHPDLAGIALEFLRILAKHEGQLLKERQKVLAGDHNITLADPDSGVRSDAVVFKVEAPEYLLTVERSYGSSPTVSVKVLWLEKQFEPLLQKPEIQLLLKYSDNVTGSGSLRAKLYQVVISSSFLAPRSMEEAKKLREYVNEQGYPEWYNIDMYADVELGSFTIIPSIRQLGIEFEDEGTPDESFEVRIDLFKEPRSNYRGDDDISVGGMDEFPEFSTIAGFLFKYFKPLPNRDLTIPHLIRTVHQD